MTILAPDLPEMRVLMDDLCELRVRYVPVERQPAPAAFFKNIGQELMRGGYDLVHSHGFTCGIGAALPAFIFGVPHIMTSHETLNVKQFAGLAGHAKKFGMSAALRFLDVVHSVSHDAQQNLLSYFPLLEQGNAKCVVIPSGIDVERFTAARKRDLRSELGVGDDVFLIGFFGRFMSPKGFRFLVDAVEILNAKGALPKRPLVLTFGEGGFIREEKQVIADRGMSGNFVFMPFTPNIAETVKGLDVVAMPSLSEACGLLAMEVLVCGIPLVGSNCIGLREVLNGTPARVMIKGDASSLARELVNEMTIDDKEEFETFKKSAASMFDVRKTSESLQDVYRTMLKKS